MVNNSENTRHKARLLVHACRLDINGAAEPARFDCDTLIIIEKS
jgi:hypothetical protein